MNMTLKSILTLTAFGATALGLLAEPAVKFATVDMGKLLDGFYKSEQEVAKLKLQEQKSKEELERMVKEGNQLADQYKETLEKAKNTLLTAEARAAAEGDSNKMLDELQKRQADINNTRANAERLLQQTLNNVRGLLLEEISKKVTELGKSKGANLVVDIHSGIVFADPAFDITDEAMVLINKDRPATPPPAAVPAASTPAPTAAPAETPTVSVPGLAPKK